MQEYFKYDKLQRGAPLFMKSDSDGSKDKDNRGLALGVKTTPEGIKHFTNWDNISNSIDSNGGLRLDDIQANNLFFSFGNRFVQRQREFFEPDDNVAPRFWSSQTPPLLNQNFLNSVGGSAAIRIPVPSTQYPRVTLSEAVSYTHLTLPTKRIV